MAEDTGQERTESATGRRREEARKKGQVAKSREVVSAAVLIGAIMILYFSGSGMFMKMSSIMRETFINSASFQVEQETLYTLFLTVSYKAFIILAPLMVTVTVLGIASNVGQFGFMLTAEPITPKLSRISPVDGLKRIFSAQAMVELLKSILKIGLVGIVAFYTVKNDYHKLLELADMDIQGMLVYGGTISFRILVNTGIVIFFLGILDYGFQRWDYEKNLRMTKEEVKREMKETEGNPQVKARIRSLQREAARRRMMQAVPKADVVITNPTHIAVALKYEAGRMKAPVVVAKGTGYIAEKIKGIARESRVPVLENKPLARAMYKLVKIGREIPADLYQAVAEILAYVYKLKK